MSAVLCLSACLCVSAAASRGQAPHGNASLLGVYVKKVSGPIDPPVKEQENTALLSNCGLTGTPLRVYLSGLEGKECSVCVHSV